MEFGFDIFLIPCTWIPGEYLMIFHIHFYQPLFPYFIQNHLTNSNSTVHNCQSWETFLQYENKPYKIYLPVGVRFSTFWQLLFAIASDWLRILQITRLIKSVSTHHVTVSSGSVDTFTDHVKYHTLNSLYVVSTEFSTQMALKQATYPWEVCCGSEYLI
jgi:hypothetical protein